MIKTIFKELIITILLCIAILLILSVLLYDYNPVNKIVPNKIGKYETPENVKEDINVNITELETTNILYKVEGSDLNMYIKANTYVQGKANPFDDTSSTVNGQTNNIGDGNNNNSNGGTTNNGTNSDETFWNSTGTK